MKRKKESRKSQAERDAEREIDALADFADHEMFGDDADWMHDCGLEFGNK